MSNVKVNPPDAFIMNCKMMYNEVGQMQDRISRMWASSDGERDQSMLEYIEDMLENIEIELRNRLDN
jgi:hypothetical protein